MVSRKPLSIKKISMYIHLQEWSFLKMPHTDGGETSGKYHNISPRSSSPVSQNIIHNTGRESLNQFIMYIHFENGATVNLTEKKISMKLKHLIYHVLHFLNISIVLWKPIHCLQARVTLFYS